MDLQTSQLGLTCVIINTVSLPLVHVLYMYIYKDKGAAGDVWTREEALCGPRQRHYCSVASGIQRNVRNTHIENAIYCASCFPRYLLQRENVVEDYRVEFDAFLLSSGVKVKDSYAATPPPPPTPPPLSRNVEAASPNYVSDSRHRDDTSPIVSNGRTRDTSPNVSHGKDEKATAAAILRSSISKDEAASPSSSKSRGKERASKADSKKTKSKERKNKGDDEESEKKERKKQKKKKEGKSGEKTSKKKQSKHKK